MSLTHVVYLYSDVEKDLAEKVAPHFTPLERTFQKKGVVFQVVPIEDIEDLPAQEKEDLRKIMISPSSAVIVFTTPMMVSRLATYEDVETWLLQRRSVLMPIILKPCAWDEPGCVLKGMTIKSKPASQGDFDSNMQENVAYIRKSLDMWAKTVRTWECPTCHNETTNRLVCSECNALMPIPYVYLIGDEKMLREWRQPIENNLKPYQMQVKSRRDVIPGHDAKRFCLDALEKADMVLFLLAPGVYSDEFVEWEADTAALSGLNFYIKLGEPMYWEGSVWANKAKKLGTMEPLSRKTSRTEAATEMARQLAEAVLK